MEKKKKINLDFFSITPEPLPDHDYKDRMKLVITAIQDLPEPEKLKPLVTTDGPIIAYGEFKKESSCLFGTLVKCQSNDIPPKFNTATHQLNPLDISELEGLGYASCFLFDFVTGILMIERIVKGPTVNSFVRFLLTNLDIPKVYSSIVINPADINKFMKMNLISKFHVRVKRVENGTIFNDGDRRKSVSQLMKPADDTNTNLMEIRLQTVKKKESLTLHTIKEFVEGLLHYKDTEEVEILEVVGQETEEEHPAFIDLIKQRLSESYFVDRERLIGTFSIREKFSAMDQIYAKHRPGLIQAYGMK